MRPIFKYWGGKNGIKEWVIQHFPPNYTKLYYIEPFCGSAAVFFAKSPSRTEIINDLDKSIYSVFKMLRDKPSRLYRRLKFTQYNENDLTEAIDLLEGKKAGDELELAWARVVASELSFLSTCKRGSLNCALHRNGGRIFKRKISRDNIAKYTARLRNTMIVSRDAERIIRQWDDPKSFFYLDPPYPETNSEPYVSSFTIDDFNALIAQLECIKGKYLISFEKKDGMHLPGHLYTKTIIRQSKKGFNTLIREKSGDKEPLKDTEAVEYLMSNYRVDKVRQLSIDSLM